MFPKGNIFKYMLLQKLLHSFRVLPSHYQMSFRGKMFPKKPLPALLVSFITFTMKMVMKVRNLRHIPKFDKTA